MNVVNSILATVDFEMSRVMTFRRLFVATVMIGFPPLMMLILDASGLPPVGEMMISVLCGMICLLSLLLWATPNVYAELEGKSWAFVTTRPWGRMSILFGKFLIAGGWSFIVAWIALSLCMVVVGPGLFASGLPRIQIWMILSILLLLASVVYAAIFSFFGVLIQRRAMVVAVGYFLVFEIMLALVPAVIGKFAMTFHLFSLLVHWIGWIIPDDELETAEAFYLAYGQFPVWMHLLALATMTSVMLGFSVLIIRMREYITLDDAQV